MPDTQLPNGLVLVHEVGDHYSLQPAREMTLTGLFFRPPVVGLRLILAELNTDINSFLTAKAQRMTKSEWLEKYPAATETC